MNSADPFHGGTMVIHKRQIYGQFIEHLIFGLGLVKNRECHTFDWEEETGSEIFRSLMLHIPTVSN